MNHGFYYTVDAAGTATADTIYAAADRRLASMAERVSRVVLGPGETYDFEFTPKDTTRLTLEIFSGARRTRIPVSARP